MWKWIESGGDRSMWFSPEVILASFPSYSLIFLVLFHIFHLYNNFTQNYLGNATFLSWIYIIVPFSFIKTHYLKSSRRKAVWIGEGWNIECFWRNYSFHTIVLPFKALLFRYISLKMCCPELIVLLQVPPDQGQVQRDFDLSVKYLIMQPCTGS